MEKRIHRVSHTVHKDGTVQKYPNNCMEAPEPISLSHIGKEAMLKKAKKNYTIKLKSLLKIQS